MGESQPNKEVHQTKNSKRKFKDDQQESILKGGATDKPSEEERREAKRLKKLEKENRANTKIKGKLEAVNESNQPEGFTSQAEWKAEKARLKAQRKAERTEGKKVKILSKNNIPHGDAVSIGTEEPRKKKSIYREDPSLTAIPQADIDGFLLKNFITVHDPASSNPLRPLTSFSHLPSDTISKPSPFSAFKSPTPIQAAAWPFLLAGRDVVGVAETGSGKTLAFGVPCIRSIISSVSSSKSHGVAKAVIVSPTRELAVQIHTQIEQLASPAQISTVCVYGGVPKEQQRAALKTAQVVVATPGRLNDLINEGFADLSSVQYLVLDEADRMLDQNFEQEIRKIISTTPTIGRQTLMFTATWPPSVRTLASTFMTNPVHISIGANNPTGALRANTSITQIVEVIDPRSKDQHLLRLLQKYQGTASIKKDRILIFCLYKKEAARTEHFLRTRLAHVAVAAIHGDMGQSARQASLDAFKSGACPLLVATDVAARGLDIPAVKVVINLTFPLTIEDYVHRIGRTGRAGEKGLAITLFTEHDKAQSGALVNVLRAAGQDVPDELLRFGTTVKKKVHEVYGAFYRDLGPGAKKEGTKIRFED